MTKGCEKPALDIMFPGMSPKICIKADIKLYLSNMKDMASFGCAFRFIATFNKYK
jgi:hypothetical protein